MTTNTITKIDAIPIEANAQGGPHTITFSETMDTTTNPSPTITGLATARAAVGWALEYVQEREAFGKPLAGQQAVQFKLVDMLAIQEQAELYTYQVAAMADPVGEIESMTKRPNGMLVGRMRVPLGVVAMIYESRPNATVDAGILCLKAGNAVILRGGSESFHSSGAIHQCLVDGVVKAGLPADDWEKSPLEIMTYQVQYFEKEK